MVAKAVAAVAAEVTAWQVGGVAIESGSAETAAETAVRAVVAAAAATAAVAG
jgi:hypothetical protein